jgi:hypothetical protein
MSKKNFKGGLDNLLSSSEFDNEMFSNHNIENIEIGEEMKHWLLIKIERLNEELFLWRTGKINVNEFNESLKKHNLKYNPQTNRIE